MRPAGHMWPVQPLYGLHHVIRELANAGATEEHRYKYVACTLLKRKGKNSKQKM